MIKEGTRLPINGRDAGVIAALEHDNNYYINVKFLDGDESFYIYKVTPEEDGFKLEREIDEEKLVVLMLEFSKKIAKDLNINE